MIKLIVFGVLGLFLVCMLIFSATSYKRMISTYRRYDNEFVYCNLNGFQFASYAIRTLKLKTRVAFIDKELEECYLPKKDIVCLSKHTAETSSVASICVTAHELGHAVQNQRQTKLYSLQMCLSVLAKLSVVLFPFVLIAGIVLLFIPEKFELGTILLLVSVVMIVVVFLLKLFTIPMEMEASRIAYKFLKEHNVLIGDELKHGKKVLDAAIGTYVASLFIPIIKFFRGIGRAFRR